MIRHLRILTLVAALTVMLGGDVRGQQQTASAGAAAMAPQPQLTQLKVQVVLSKYQGEKRLSSLPYTLAVIANDKSRAEIANVVQVLIPFVSVEGKIVGPVYKDVGTKMFCAATRLDDGRFRLEIIVEDSSVYADDQPGEKPSRASPWLRSFRSEQTLLLKDGQTTQYTTGTDKISGEVVKVDVTLAVVK